MEEVWVFVVVFCAIFTQSLAGFGLGLVAMPLLAEVVGLPVAAPLVAIIALVAEVALLIRYREALELAAIWRLMLGAGIAIPLGVWGLPLVNERAAVGGLGALLVGYAGYALLGLRVPTLHQPRWAYGFGAAAGLLSGAFNTGGPPVVIYGSCRRWPPEQFKGNLQSFFLLNSVLVLLSHALSQHLTPAIWRLVFLSLPAIALGVGLGLALERYINPHQFRLLVLGLLLVIGLRLLL